MDGGCGKTEESNCMNSICVKCDTKGKDISSDCFCETGFFYDKDSDEKCIKCHDSCKNCSGPEEN